MGFKREVGDILVGTAAIEWGPGLVQDAFGDLGVGHEAVAGTELGQIVEGGVDFIQGIAPSLAGLALVWVGLKTMFKGFEGGKEK